jgi:hypothetical protein
MMTTLLVAAGAPLVAEAFVIGNPGVVARRLGWVGLLSRRTADSMAPPEIG